MLKAWKAWKCQELKAKSEIPKVKFAMPKAKSENWNAETPKQKSCWRNAAFHLAVKVHWSLTIIFKVIIAKTSAGKMVQLNIFCFELCISLTKKVEAFSGFRMYAQNHTFWKLGWLSDHYILAADYMSRAGSVEGLALSAEVTAQPHRAECLLFSEHLLPVQESL